VRRDPVRLVVAELEVPGSLAAADPIEPAERRIGQHFAVRLRDDRRHPVLCQDLIHPATRGDFLRCPRTRLVVDPGECGGIARLAQDLPQMALVGVEIPGELRMRQPHHAIAVWIAPGEERSARGAALRRGAEGLREADSLGGETIERRTLHRRIAVATEEPTEIVTGNQQQIRTLSHRTSPSPYTAAQLSRATTTPTPRYRSISD